MEKILDKIIKKITQIEKLRDKESLFCEEIKDLVEDIREEYSESEDEDFDTEDLEEDDIDEEEEKE
jgi:hypothetical protein